METGSGFRGSTVSCPGNFDSERFIPTGANFIGGFVPVHNSNSGRIAEGYIMVISFLIFLATLSLLFCGVVCLDLEGTRLGNRVRQVTRDISSNRAAPRGGGSSAVG